jgi:hypothetical protein
MMPGVRDADRRILYVGQTVTSEDGARGTVTLCKAEDRRCVVDYAGIPHEYELDAGSLRVPVKLLFHKRYELESGGRRHVVRMPLPGGAVDFMVYGDDRAEIVRLSQAEALALLEG